MGNDIWKHHVDQIKAFQGTSIREVKLKESCVEDMIRKWMQTRCLQAQRKFEYQECSDSERQYPLRERRPP